MLLKAPTLTEMWDGACRKMFFGTADQLSKGSSMTIAYENLLKATSMQYEMDVGADLNLTKSRFPKLQRDYLQLGEYEDFMVRCKNAAKRKGAVTRLTCTPHKPVGVNSFKTTGNYAHGGCMLGFTFRVGKRNDPPVLGLHSRVSYISYMGALDLALGYVIAKEVGAELGYAVEDFSFVWYCDSFQWANMQSMAYVWNRPDLVAALRKPKKYPDRQYPTINLMRRTLLSWEKKMEEGFTPKQEKYAQLMRYRTRFERVVNGDPLPSIPVDTLTLDALRRPVRVRPDYMEEEDDDE